MAWTPGSHVSTGCVASHPRSPRASSSPRAQRSQGGTQWRAHGRNPHSLRSTASSVLFRHVVSLVLSAGGFRRRGPTGFAAATCRSFIRGGVAALSSCLSPQPSGFTASDLAVSVVLISRLSAHHVWRAGRACCCHHFCGTVLLVLQGKSPPPLLMGRGGVQTLACDDSARAMPNEGARAHVFCGFRPLTHCALDARLWCAVFCCMHTTRQVISMYMRKKASWVFEPRHRCNCITGVLRPLSWRDVVLVCRPTR